MFVNKLSYRLHDPHRGDVVVLHELTGATERDLIKRVIALPGESIEIRNCEVDDRRQEARRALPRSAGRRRQLRRRLGPTVVPNDNVFVMGDNRPGSLDSRTLGPIPIHDIVGRAFVVFWPKAHWQWL